MAGTLGPCPGAQSPSRKLSVEGWHFVPGKEGYLPSAGCPQPLLGVLCVKYLHRLQGDPRVNLLHRLDVSVSLIMFTLDISVKAHLFLR